MSGWHPSVFHFVECLLRYTKSLAKSNAIEEAIAVFSHNISPYGFIAFRPCYARKAALSRHHHIVVPAGAVDDKHIAAAVKSADNADMGSSGKTQGRPAGHRSSQWGYSSCAVP